MALRYYILQEDGTSPVISDYFEWLSYFYHKSRLIALDKVEGTVVSTIFLGISYGEAAGYPLLFETKALGPNIPKHKKRYATYEEALEGHRLTLYSINQEAHEQLFQADK